MKVKEFLEQTAEALEYENTINIDDSIDGIEGWDSLGVLSIVGMLDAMGLSIEIGQFEKIETIRDYLDLVGVSDD